MNTIFLLSQTENDIASIDISNLSGKLNMGTQVLILGMLMVFAVLGVIFVALKIFGLFLHGTSDKKKPAEQPVTPVIEQPIASEDEVIAAIAAAIAAAESETPEARFRVVSFRRIS